MKVVMLILEFAPTVGGAQRQLQNVAPLLAQRGVEVHVLTRAVSGHPARERAAGCEIHRLPAPGPKASASLLWTAAALQRIRQLQPDVVHAYSLFSPATIAIVARRLLDTPTVAKVLRGGEGGDVQRLLAKTLGRTRAQAMATSIDRFMTISDEIDDELARMGVTPEKRVRIVNGVDIRRFHRAKASERAEIRSELGLTAGPVVAQCGRFVPEKRLDALMRIWPRVRRVHPHAQLALMGSGPCEAALRADASPGVHFLGERDDVSRILGAADAFVLPSAAEGLSNAMLEAMASELAVVATRVGGAADVIENQANGRLVDSGDDDALADALCDVCNENERARLGEAARATMETRFSLGQTADRLFDLYRDLSAEEGSTRTASPIQQ